MSSVSKVRGGDFPPLRTLGLSSHLINRSFSHVMSTDEIYAFQILRKPIVKGQGERKEM
jgi:hypothetical protein